MFNNVGNLFKKAQEMQAKMAEFQEEMEKRRIEVSTGGGMVKLTTNGLHQVLSLHIDEELINMKDREILEDLIIGAVNEANRKTNYIKQEEMKKFTGGINIPGLFPS